ncbi:MAG TPA: peptidylprolyl isomerase SurA [Aeromonadales bacterium]|nr:peptidylprolyl isomerase SurA [Aeromonadales bacterium]
MKLLDIKRVIMKTFLIKFIPLMLISMQLMAAEVSIFDRIVAIVDDDVILSSELDRKVASYKEQLKANKAQLPDEKTFRKQVLERVIVDNLQLQLAKQAGVRISDQELNATIATIAKNSGKTVEQFQKALEDEGENYTIFREDLRKEIMMTRVRQGQVGRRVFISEQEVDDMVQLMDEQGKNNTQYHIGHIMVAIPESSTPDEITAARNKAKEIVDLLRNGADFSKVAIAQSDSQDALKGGDFGWRPITALPSLFTGPVSNLKVGDITDPLRSASGLHILKLFDKKGGEEQKLVQQVKARHILIKTSKITSEAQAKALLEKLYKQIKEGADFADLAKKYSEDLGSGSQGGLLDWADPNIYAPKFKEQLEVMKEGDLSKPFRSQFGWHIIQFLGRRISDETVKAKREKAKRLLFSRKFDEEVVTWLREIRAEAYVKILHEDEYK